MWWTTAFCFSLLNFLLVTCAEVSDIADVAVQSADQKTIIESTALSEGKNLTNSTVDVTHNDGYGAGLNGGGLFAGRPQTFMSTGIGAMGLSDRATVRGSAITRETLASLLSGGKRNTRRQMPWYQRSVKLNPSYGHQDSLDYSGYDQTSWDDQTAWMNAYGGGNTNNIYAAQSNDLGSQHGSTQYVGDFGNNGVGSGLAILPSAESGIGGSASTVRMNGGWNQMGNQQLGGNWGQQTTGQQSMLRTLGSWGQGGGAQTGAQSWVTNQNAGLGTWRPMTTGQQNTGIGRWGQNSWGANNGVGLQSLGNQGQAVAWPGQTNGQIGQATSWPTQQPMGQTATGWIGGGQQQVLGQIGNTWGGQPQQQVLGVGQLTGGQQQGVQGVVQVPSYLVGGQSGGAQSGYTWGQMVPTQQNTGLGWGQNMGQQTGLGQQPIIQTSQSGWGQMGTGQTGQGSIYGNIPVSQQNIPTFTTTGGMGQGQTSGYGINPNALGSEWPSQPQSGLSAEDKAVQQVLSMLNRPNTQVMGANMNMPQGPGMSTKVSLPDLYQALGNYRTLAQGARTEVLEPSTPRFPTTTMATTPRYSPATTQSPKHNINKILSPHEVEAIATQDTTTAVGALVQQIRRLPAVAYSRADCVECRKSEEILKDIYGIPLVVFYLDRIGTTDAMIKLLTRVTGQKTLPQFFLCGHYIGGHENILHYFDNGQIPDLLRNCLDKQKTNLEPIRKLRKR